MSTIYNPLSNRLVLESGSIGSIIKNIKDWSSVEVVTTTAKRMHSQYRSKLNKVWKNDFLKIVEHYCAENIEQAREISDNILQRERERVETIHLNYEFSFIIQSLLNQTRGSSSSSGNTPQSISKKQVNKTLKERIIKDKQCECAICLNFDESEDKVVEMPCKHKYHQKCISQWVSKVNNCPLCKRKCI